MPREGFEIRQTAIAELEARDPELYRAVRYVIFWKGSEDTPTSLEEFKRQAVKEVARLTKIRLATRRPEFE
jgi:hypothetical protein